MSNNVVLRKEAVLAEVEQIRRCDEYLNERTGKYEWRRIRYRAALHAMLKLGLSHSDTVVDVGAGWTEFDYCLRVDGGSRARYIPIDGCIDGVDLNEWTPPRECEFFVALELLEHLQDPSRLIAEMQRRCSKGIIISTPNPRTTDVLGMDRTHVHPIEEVDLIDWGFQHVKEVSFYGQEADSLFAIWTP